MSWRDHPYRVSRLCHGGIRDGRDGGVTINVYNDALLTPQETARHLQLPTSTLNYWVREQAAGEPAGEPLVHRVPPARRGWPSLPFVAVIEAHVRDHCATSA